MYPFLGTFCRPAPISSISACVNLIVPDACKLAGAVGPNCGIECVCCVGSAERKSLKKFKVEDHVVALGGKQSD